MSATTTRRLHQLAAGLVGIERKVFEAVPINESWPIGKVCGEIARSGSNPDHKTVLSCLHKMADSGILRESQGRFIRVQPKEEKPVSHVREVSKPIKSATTPIERLSGIADRFRSIADEIDEIALSIDDREKSLRADSEKLRQLQSLLKGV